jgi:hypothetical protein
MRVVREKQLTTDYADFSLEPSAFGLLIKLTWRDFRRTFTRRMPVGFDAGCGWWEHD